MKRQFSNHSYFILAVVFAAIAVCPVGSIAIELEICGFAPGNPIPPEALDAEQMQLFSFDRTRLDSVELVVGDLAPNPGQPWTGGNPEAPPTPTASVEVQLGLDGVGPFDPIQSSLTILGNWFLVDEADSDFFQIGGQFFDTFGLCDGDATNCTFEVEIDDVSGFVGQGDKLGVTFDYFDGDNENDLGFPAAIPLRFTTFELNVVALPPTNVQNVQLFYNGSVFDGNGTVVDSSDFAAIAPDKGPLSFGESGGATNISGYSRGINGLFIDIDDLPADGAGMDANDFAFTLGNDDAPDTWVSSPPPMDVGVLVDQGEGGADRVYVTFADGAIADAWLHMTILANADTGLASDASFFFGAAPGETGASFTSNFVAADAADLHSIARNVTLLADAGTEPITEPNDLNRDGTVDAFDLQVVATNLDFNIINYITPQLGAASAATAVPEPSAESLLAMAAALAILVYRRGLALGCLGSKRSVAASEFTTRSC